MKRPRFKSTPTPLEGSSASLASRTKKTLVATERRRAKVKKQREDWFKHRAPAVSARPERVVFIDETSVKTNLTRQRGWSQRGERLVMDAPFGSWGTQTFIAGLTADAMIAPWVIKGAMDGPAFTAYFEKVLVPELEPGTVVILPPTRTPKQPKPCATQDAGSCFCRPTALISILSKWPSRNSRPTCVASAHAHSPTCSMLCPRFAISTQHKSAGTISQLPGMSQIQGRTL